MKYALVEGDNREKGWNEEKNAYNKVFDPYRVVAVGDRDYLTRVKKQMIDKQKGLPRREKASYKIVKDSVYPDLVENFLVAQHIEMIANEISNEYRDKEDAAVTLAWRSLARELARDEIMNIDLDDFDVRVEASEGISVPTSSSTWSWIATGTIAGHEVRGVHVGDTHKV